MIRQVKKTDAAAIAEIYNWYIESGIVSFEEEPVSSGEISKRFERADDTNPWLVFEVDNQLVGYAYAIPWKARIAYRHSKESTVYIHKEHLGKGYGLKLMQTLIDDLRNKPIHVLIAGIALPNEASIRLHEKLGFKKIGRFEEVGMKFNKMIDVGYWQLTL